MISWATDRSERISTVDDLILSHQLTIPPGLVFEERRHRRFSARVSTTEEKEEKDRRPTGSEPLDPII